MEPIEPVPMLPVPNPSLLLVPGPDVVPVLEPGLVSKVPAVVPVVVPLPVVVTLMRPNPGSVVVVPCAKIIDATETNTITNVDKTNLLDICYLLSKR